MTRFHRGRPCGIKITTLSGATASVLGCLLAARSFGQSAPSDNAQDDPARILNWAQNPTSSPDFPAMGCLPSPPSARTRNARLRVVQVAPSSRPARLLLTDYLPPVGDQGALPSSSGWAAGYYCYSYGVARQLALTPQQRATPRFLFSPAYLYHLGKSGPKGMPLSKAFELLKKEGCATLSEMPYNPTIPATPPSDASQRRAQRYKARMVAQLFSGKPSRAGTPANPAILKSYLARMQTPFVMALPVFKDFPAKNARVANNFVYRLGVSPTQANFRGMQAVAVIGYDDAKKAFRIVNSWGANWGDRGFLWLSEEFVRDWGSDGWSTVPGGPVARGYALVDARGRVKLPLGVSVIPPSAPQGGPK